MKVILLKDVANVGKRYDVKEVSSGYALNFLIPNKLAESGTPGAIKKLEQRKTKDSEKRKAHDDHVVKNLKELEGKTIELKEPANDKGHLFKGVHKEEVVAEVKNQTTLELLPDHIILDKPLKEVGEHTVEASVGGKSAKFKVVISAK